MINEIKHSDYKDCLLLLRESFATVANEFNLTEENCPTHTSFIQMRNLEYHAKSGFLMYGYFSNNKLLGYVSLENKGGGVFELHKLAVLPEHRHKGIGKQLLDFCKSKTIDLNGDKIILGIIEENIILKNWYESNGFIHIGTKNFEHLPFIVGYMECSLK